MISLCSPHRIRSHFQCQAAIKTPKLTAPQDLVSSRPPCFLDILRTLFSIFLKFYISKSPFLILFLKYIQFPFIVYPSGAYSNDTVHKGPSFSMSGRHQLKKSAGKNSHLFVIAYFFTFIFGVSIIRFVISAFTPIFFIEFSSFSPPPRCISLVCFSPPVPIRPRPPWTTISTVPLAR